MGEVLAGRVVLITGAARGIGAATARLAVARGARVALLGLEPDLLRTLSDELNEHSGRSSAAFDCDVTDQSALELAVAAAADTFGQIDAVVANAGVANLGTVAISDPAALCRTVEVNLLGVMRTVSATLPHVIATRGYYLLVSSAASFSVLPGMAAYCASKAGVEHFGHALRLELAHRGVGVGTAHPTWVDTDLVRDAQADLPSFRETLRRLPWPAGAYTSVDACAAALVRALERRSRRIYVPRALAGLQAMRSLLNSPLADAVLGRSARRMVPQLEDEVRALGRSFGTHSAGLGKS